MEPYPRTTRPVGAEAAAGGAPATTQAAQRLGSGITDGPNFDQNHHRGFLRKSTVEKTRGRLESTVDFYEKQRWQNASRPNEL